MRKRDRRTPSKAGLSRRRTQAAIGATGVAVVLGAGVFLIVDHQRPDESPTITAGAGPDQEPQEPQERKSGAVHGPVQPQAQAQTAKERAAAARKVGEERGVPVKRPLPGEIGVRDADVEVKESGTLQKHGEQLKVMSAESDLTGQRELAWVADLGKPYGSATCSQTFKLANEEKAAKKPNLLICWRTSTSKSVYTVLVDLDGKPSKEKSVKALEKRWKAMG
ncbi:hypothetical protein AB0M02_18835 [Actinoplanes sp. NPDC051861]|uniref:hypothetical protein n=1 Tax=Actinoplanes sp. NPDC051861 TaxID=3155170 RepID=UPI00341860A9